MQALKVSQASSLAQTTTKWRKSLTSPRLPPKFAPTQLLHRARPDGLRSTPLWAAARVLTAAYSSEQHHTACQQLALAAAVHVSRLRALLGRHWALIGILSLQGQLQQAIFLDLVLRDSE